VNHFFSLTAISENEVSDRKQTTKSIAGSSKYFCSVYFSLFSYYFTATGASIIQLDTALTHLVGHDVMSGQMHDLFSFYFHFHAVKVLLHHILFLRQLL
jgi:hypothetical protein